MREPRHCQGGERGEGNLAIVKGGEESCMDVTVRGSAVNRPL